MQMITEIMWNNTIKHNQGRWFGLNADKRSIYKMIEVIIMTLKKANDVTMTMTKSITITITEIIAAFMSCH